MNGNPLPKGKKVKKKSNAKLKKKLDAVFSLFIRNKYSKNGQVKCFTCGVSRPVSNIQNGHFVPRNALATRFDEDNCRPQCVGCNVFGQGRPVIFANNLEKELGKGTVARLYAKAQEITKDYPYEEKIVQYKALLASLEK